MRILSGFVAMLPIALLVLSAVCIATDNGCGDNYETLGKRAISPAKVIGLPSQRLELQLALPPYGPENQNTNHRPSYLMTGDKVDLVSTCKDRAYVRFHGKENVSTGWVDRNRIVTTGNPYVRIPTNAAKLCAAAQNSLNTNFAQGKLTYITTPDVDDKLRDRIWDSEDAWNGIGTVPSGATKITVNGHKMWVVDLSGGGVSCRTTEIQIWKADLKSRLSPSDFEYRDGYQAMLDALDGPVTQGLVEVDGQLMILTSSGPTPVLLSSIDSDGDVEATCQIERVPSARPIVLAGKGNKICHAIADSSVERIPLHEPQMGHSAAPLTDEQKGSLVLNSQVSQGPQTNDESLDKVGVADLDNSQTTRAVGVIANNISSGAGCGYGFVETHPVFLRKDGRADLLDPSNQRLMTQLSWGSEETRLVRLDGVTYIDMARKERDPEREVWKLSGDKVDKMCTFQVTQYRVSVISSDDLQGSPGPGSSP